MHTGRPIHDLWILNAYRFLVGILFNSICDIIFRLKKIFIFNIYIFSERLTDHTQNIEMQISNKYKNPCISEGTIHIRWKLFNDKNT